MRTSSHAALRVAIAASVVVIASPSAFGAEGGTALVDGMKEIVVKGGVCMIFLLIGSVMGVAIIFERFVSLRSGLLAPPSRLKALREKIRAQRFDEVRKDVDREAAPLDRILAAGLRRAEKGHDEMEKTMAAVGSRELHRLKRPSRYLAVLASVQPLLGLMGTVFGMIKTFNVLHSTSAAERVGKLAPGIAEALYTTAAGLVSAVPFLIAYHYFLGKANAAADRWSEVCTDLVDAEIAARSRVESAAAPHPVVVQAGIHAAATEAAVA